MQDAGEHQLEWRDTYFVFFQRADRPTLTQVEGAIDDATRHVTLENLEADDDGLFESVLVQVPDDNAALEISYETGDAVIEQSADLAKQLRKEISSAQLAQMLRADARFDVMLFERIRSEELATDDEDWEAVALDPASLLSVVDALAKLTGGLPVDPASGAVLG